MIMATLINDASLAEPLEGYHPPAARFLGSRIKPGLLRRPDEAGNIDDLFHAVEVHAIGSIQRLSGSSLKLAALVHQKVRATGSSGSGIGEVGRDEP